MTSTHFAGGASDISIAFSGCAANEGSLRFEIPRGAVVENATVRATLAPNSTATAAQLTVDIGGDGSPDGVAALVSGVPVEVPLVGASLTSFVGLFGYNDSIFARVSACPLLGDAFVTLDQLNITYWSYNSNARPAAVADVPVLEVRAGSSVYRAFDLAPLFEDPQGETLRYGVVVSPFAPPPTHGVEARMNGSFVDFTSTNVSFFGEVWFSYFAADPHGLVATHEFRPVYVRPLPPASQTTTTLRGPDGTAGSMRYSQFFPSIPGDATFVNASLELSSPLSAQTLADLATTISIQGPGGATLASVDATVLPLTVNLSLAAMNEHIALYSQHGVSWMDVEVSVDSHGGMATVNVTNLTLVYTRPPDGPLPTIAGISVNGTNATSHLANDLVRFDVRIEPLSRTYYCLWFLDGVQYSEGFRLETYLAPGNRSVEARVFNLTGNTSFVLPFESLLTTAPLPSASTIRINGAVSTQVEANRPTWFSVASPDVFAPGLDFNWTLDGKVVGYGPEIYGVYLGAGNRTISVQISNASARVVISLEFRALPSHDRLPVIEGVTLNGNNATGVVTLPGATSVTLSANFTGLEPGHLVQWYVDGGLVHEGTNASGVVLEAGNHTIELRVSNATSSLSYTFHAVVEGQVVQPPLPPGSPYNLFLIISFVALGAVGSVLGGTQSGRWLLLGVVGGSVFSRLKRPSLLDHFVRGTLYQVIREEPGIHFAELRRRADLSNGSASHHLRMMEKGGYIRVVIDGTKTRFFTTDQPLDKEVYGISDTDKAVLEAVVERPGIGQVDLTAQLNKSASTVSRSVGRLVALGYVVTSREGGKVLVFPRPGAELVDPLEPAWPDEER